MVLETTTSRSESFHSRSQQSSEPLPRIQRVAVLGGAVGGLAAAEGFSKRGFEVDLFERQSYDDKRVNCGEAMTAVSKIPLRSMSANGFVNALPELRVDIYEERHPADSTPGVGDSRPPIRTSPTETSLNDDGPNASLKRAFRFTKTTRSRRRSSGRWPINTTSWSTRLANRRLPAKFEGERTSTRVG